MVVATAPGMRTVGGFTFCAPKNRFLSIRRVLLGAAVASLAACGSEHRGLTEPTASSEVFVHNTLNRADDRLRLDLSWSVDATSYLPMISTLLPWAWDDFTSADTTTIRTISWQGAYCRSSRLGPVPSGPAAAVSNSFTISFYNDTTGPYFDGAKYAVKFTPDETHEHFAFDAVWGEFGCAYYDYTAVLPTPFPVTAGTHYWLLIRAVSDTTWGWRVGRQDNGASKRGELRIGVVSSPLDLAFSLSSR